MNTSRYKTPRALEVAVKAAAKKSSLDVNKALNDYYQGRFVERIFSEHPSAFVLKGGMSMLADRLIR